MTTANPPRPPRPSRSVRRARGTSNTPTPTPGGPAPGTALGLPGALTVPETLRATAVGARQIGVYSEKECDALHLVVGSGGDPAKFAKDSYGVETTISAAALTTGNQHEEALLDNGAEKLREAAYAAERLDRSETGFVDVAVEYPIKPGMRPAAKLAAKRDRVHRTKTLLREFVTGQRTTAVIAHATFAITRPDGQFGTIELDALLLSAHYDHIRPVEIKTFHNADGFTDQAAMRSLQRQGAVEVYALRGTLAELDAELGLSGAGSLVARQSETVDIVLRGPQLHRDLCVAGPLKLIDRLLSLTTLAGYGPEIAAALAAIGQAEPVLTKALFEQLPYNYASDCREFCPLADPCRERAEAAGNLEVLGHKAARTFAPAGTVQRAVALMDGSVAPTTTDEHSLVLAFDALDAELVAIGHPSLRAVI